ncbi:hypothetical protein GCM10027398_16240 [Azotobacter salinestris]
MSIAAGHADADLKAQCATDRAGKRQGMSVSVRLSGWRIRGFPRAGKRKARPNRFGPGSGDFRKGVTVGR